MMPTLRQLKSLKQLLFDLHYLSITPSAIKFSKRQNKPFIIIVAESNPSTKDAKWYCIDDE